MREILVAIGSRTDVRLWRQNAGRARVTSHSGTDRWIEMAPSGAADLTGILKDGRRLEIEVKRPRLGLTADQLRWKAMVERFGGVYVLAHSAAEATSAVNRALGL